MPIFRLNFLLFQSIFKKVELSMSHLVLLSFGIHLIQETAYTEKCLPQSGSWCFWDLDSWHCFGWKTQLDDFWDDDDDDDLLEPQKCFCTNMVSFSGGLEDRDGLDCLLSAVRALAILASTVLSSMLLLVSFISSETHSH